MNEIRRVLSSVILAALQTPAQAESRASFSYKWNVYGFFASGASLGETRAGFQGGGGGIEAFVWKRFTAAADVSAFRDQYYWAHGTFGHAGAQVGYHFAGREKIRGTDPFLFFGAGRFFPADPEDARAAVHGGFGLIYWFKQRVGARFEVPCEPHAPGTVKKSPTGGTACPTA
jgi:hypothetical protein